MRRRGKRPLNLSDGRREATTLIFSAFFSKLSRDLVFFGFRILIFPAIVGFPLTAAHTS